MNPWEVMMKVCIGGFIFLFAQLLLECFFEVIFGLLCLTVGVAVFYQVGSLALHLIGVR